jgi:peptidoglycan/LPS O-acetylase OafA/YrhL
MSTRFLTFTGKRSYGLYLWHMVPFVIIGKGTGMSGFLMRAPIMLLATYGLAELSWRFVESPFIKRKHKKYTNVSGR